MVEYYRKKFTEDTFASPTSPAGPSFSESFSAGFGYQYSPIIARTQEELYFGSVEFDEDFTPFDQIEGYEGFEQDFARAKNQEHLNFIKESIDQNLKNRAILAESDFFSGALVAGIVDPLNLAFALPVVGQLGLIARGGMTIRQAALASAKGGLAAGVAAEAIRAPFDTVNTAGETAMNLLTTTAFSTLLGSAPSVARGAAGAYTDSISKLRDLAKGEMGDEIDGTKIIYSDSSAESVSTSTKGITVNTSKIEKEFYARPWVKEEKDLQKGEIPLQPNSFINAREYQDFLINKENVKLSVKREPGESSIAYENRVNQTALDRTYQGYGLKETPFTNSIWFKMIPTPGKTILLDKQVPEVLKRFYQLLEGNGAMAMQRNVAGLGTQSLRQRLPVYTVRSHNLLKKIRAKYNEEKKGTDTTSQFAGLDLDKGQKRKLVGMKGGADVWFEKTVDMFIAASDPRQRSALMEAATPQQREVFDIIRQHFDDFLVDAQDVGLLRDIKNINLHLKKSREELDKINQRQQELDLSEPELRKYVPPETDAEIASGPTGAFKVVDGKEVYRAAFYNRLENRIYIDEEYIAQQFPNKPWTKPKVPGVKGYSADEFVDAEEWVNFVKTHEIFHTLYSAKDLGFDKTTPKGLADYENAINDMAIKEIRRQRQEPKLSDEANELAIRAAKLEEEIRYYEGYSEFAGSRSKFIMPIYYDKQLLKNNAEARAKLTKIFEEHISKETKYWDVRKGEWKDKAADYDNAAAAEKIMANILEEQIDDVFVGATSPRGGKHLRHRALDIPEYMVKDFILKNEAVFYTYADKMGRRIEWQRNFGNMNRAQFLKYVEDEMVKAGASPKKVAKIKAAFAGDIDRVMGRLITNPDSLSNQAVRAIKETAGLTYLHQAGLSSVTETAMMVFERGLGKTFEPLMNVDVAQLFAKAASDIDATVDGSGLARNMMQDRYIGDSIRGIQPNAVERIFNPITNAFYNIPLLGNNLGMVTRYGKIVDGVFRQSELIRMSVDVAKNRAKPEDVEYLARYGIDENTAKQIASLDGVWETNKKGTFYYANKDAWPRGTAADRDLLLKWETAMNSGVGNTIMHATSFDKPLLADGATYVRWYPWMDTLTLGRLKPDPDVSTANIPMTKIETGMLGMPFQFLSFTLAATNRITGQIFDPARQHRLIGAAALFGMAYLSLQLKKPDWWFESKSTSELIMRVADFSGVFGIYADLFYMANHAMIEAGYNEETIDMLKGRYNVKDGDSAWEIAGAGPGMVRSWFEASKNLMDGYTTEGLTEFYYNTPTVPALWMFGLKEDVKDLILPGTDPQIRDIWTRK